MAQCLQPTVITNCKAIPMLHRQVDKTPRPFSSPSLSLSANQSGFTLIELMAVFAVIGILGAIALASYQTQVRRSQLITIYQEINQFRLPYEMLMHEGEWVSEFTPTGLSMPTQTEYCQFSVTPPVANATTVNAVTCQIKHINYLQDQSISLDRGNGGNWQCRASRDISEAYLPQECQ